MANLPDHVQLFCTRHLTYWVQHVLTVEYQFHEEEIRIASAMGEVPQPLVQFKQQQMLKFVTQKFLYCF